MEANAGLGQGKGLDVRSWHNTMFELKAAHEFPVKFQLGTWVQALASREQRSQQYGTLLNAVRLNHSSVPPDTPLPIFAPVQSFMTTVSLPQVAENCNTHSWTRPEPDPTTATCRCSHRSSFDHAQAAAGSSMARVGTRHLMCACWYTSLPVTCEHNRLSLLPYRAQVFITMTDKYKKDIVPIARDLGNLGFGLVATSELMDEQGTGGS